MQGKSSTCSNKTSKLNTILLTLFCKTIDISMAMHMAILEERHPPIQDIHNRITILSHRDEATSLVAEQRAEKQPPAIPPSPLPFPCPSLSPVPPPLPPPQWANCTHPLLLSYSIGLRRIVSTLFRSHCNDHFPPGGVSIFLIPVL